MAKRTDPHRPGAIIPSEYVYILSYELAHNDCGWPVPSIGVNCEANHWHDGKEWHHGTHSGDACCVVRLQQRAVSWAERGSTGKCTVCGAHFNRGDVWQHEPTGEHIHIGWCCAEKYSLLVDRTEFELKAERWKAAQAKIVQAERPSGTKIAT